MNCASQLNPSIRLILVGLCPDCPSQDRLSYQWTLVRSSNQTEQPVDLSGQTTTGQSKSYLAINTGTFAADSTGATYLVHLESKFTAI